MPSRTWTNETKENARVMLESGKTLAQVRDTIRTVKNKKPTLSQVQSLRSTLGVGPQQVLGIKRKRKSKSNGKPRAAGVGHTARVEVHTGTWDLVRTDVSPRDVDAFIAILTAGQGK